MTSSSSLYGTVNTQNTQSTNSTSLYGGADTPIPTPEGNLIVRGDLIVLSGNILTTAATGNIFPANATTISLGLAATTMNIGASTGTTTINNNLTVDGTTINLAQNTDILYSENNNRLNRPNIQSTTGNTSGLRIVAPNATASAVSSVTTISTNDSDNTKFVSLQARGSANPLRLQTGQFIGGVQSASGESVTFADFSNIYATVNPSGPTIGTDLTTKTYVDSAVAGGVTSITGTANQVIASSPTGAVTLSLPQSIATTSNVTFADVIVGDDLTVQGNNVNLAPATTIGYDESGNRANRPQVQSTTGNNSGFRVLAPNATTSANSNVTAFATNDINNGEFISLRASGSTSDPFNFRTGKYTAGVLGASGKPISFVDNVTTYATINPSGPTNSTDLITKAYFNANPSAPASSLVNGAYTLALNANGTVSFPSYIFPYAGGTTNQVLKTDGSGNLSWVNGSVTLGTTAVNLGATSLTLGGLTSVEVTQDPTTNLQLATKQYVDNTAAVGLTFHEPVYVATVVNVTAVTYNQPGGAGVGVGATLTRTSSFATLQIDGVVVPLNARVLVRLQSSQIQNGVYTVTNTGSPSTGWVLTRATDADTYGSGANQLSLNDYFFVQNGSTQANIAYVLNAPVGTITFGTSNITFAEFSRSTTYTGSTPIDVTGTVISLTTVPITLGGTGQVTANAALNALLPSQTANSGKYLTTNGTDSSWNALPVDPNTTYTYTAGSVSGGANLTLTGSDATTNTIKLSNGGFITAVQTSATEVTLGSNATNANTASTIVARDASGNFSAGTITAALSGNATTATTAAQVANSLTAGTYLSGGPFNGSAAVTLSTNATSANTASTLVARDASGNFSAGTITANFTNGSRVLGAFTATPSTSYVFAGPVLTSITDNNGVDAASSYDTNNGNGNGAQQQFTHYFADTFAALNTTGALAFRTANGNSETTGTVPFTGITPVVPSATLSTNTFGTINYAGYATTGFASSIASASQGGGRNVNQNLQIQAIASENLADGTLTISGATITAVTRSSTTLASVAVTGTKGQISFTATTPSLGNAIVVTGTNSGTATGISAGTYYITLTGSTSTAQLSLTPNGNPITTTAGTTTGLTFTRQFITVTYSAQSYIPFGLNALVSISGFTNVTAGTYAVQGTSTTTSVIIGAVSTGVPALSGSQSISCPTVTNGGGTLRVRAMPLAKPMNSGNRVELILHSAESATYRADAWTFTTGAYGATGTTMLTMNNTAVVASVPIQFPVYTIAGKPASGVVGQQISISNSPTVGGRMAFWDTTNSRWSYISDNAAV